VIARAGDGDVLERVLAGADVGTLCLPQGAPLASRKHWIGYTLKARGALLIDAGAVAALRAQRRSLLAAGVVGVRGGFKPGDAVGVFGPDGEEVARGLVRYATEDVARIAGARTPDVEARLGRAGAAIVVHRDDL